jgi:phosphohistidine phosphatase
VTNWPDLTDAGGEPRRLVLVRHSKAVAESGSGDRARRLSDRGRNDAGTAGGWLDWRIQRLDAIWSSSAARTRETTELMCAKLTDPPTPAYRDDLYDAGPEDVLDMLRAVPDEVRNLVVVGHNPTIEQLHALLTGKDRTYKTSAAAILEIDSDWVGLGPGDAQVADFFTP